MLSGCKNTIRNGYARIMSPGYGITKYPNSINCNWTIIDPEKRQLTLVFDQFDTEKDYDNVTVSNLSLSPISNRKCIA